MQVGPLISTYTDPRQAIAEGCVQGLLAHLGEDPDRDGLKDTPARVVKAFKEMTCGYGQDPAQILSRTFSQEEDCGYPTYDGYVVLRDIEFSSLCEHHLLPFVGRAHVAYMPGEDGRIVGISKFARLVDCFAHRLQVQERLTAQITDAVYNHLGASAVMVIIESEHYCMKLRGCKKQQSVMRTCETRGVCGNARHDAMYMLNLLERK